MLFVGKFSIIYEKKQLDKFEKLPYNKEENQIESSLQVHTDIVQSSGADFIDGILLVGFNKEA